MKQIFFGKNPSLHKYKKSLSIKLSVIFFILYALVRFYIFYSFDIDYSWRFPDTQQYHGLSMLPFSDVRLWILRPILYPLLLKGFGSTRILLLFQVSLSITVWWMFAYKLVYQKIKLIVNRRVACIAILITLGLSLTFKLVQFDGLILTESLAMSFILIWCSCFLKCLDHKFQKISYCINLIVISALLMLLRDINATFLLLCTPLFAYITWYYRSFYAFTVLISVLIFYGLSSYTMNLGERWCPPLVNAVYSRLIFKPDADPMFVLAKTPEDQFKLSSQKARHFEGDLEDLKLCTIDLFDTNPELSYTLKEKKKQATNFQKKGQSQFKLFLLHTPSYLFSPLSMDCERSLNICLTWQVLSDPMPNYYNYLTFKHTIITKFFLLINSIYSQSLFAIINFIALMIIICGNKKLYSSIYWQVCTYLWLLSIGLCILILHADSIEMQRHVLIDYFCAFIFSILMVVFSCSILLNRPLRKLAFM